MRALRHRNLGALYESHLKSRGFEVSVGDGNIIVAKYTGHHFLRERDGDLQYTIQVEGNDFVLNADDVFYANRLYLQLEDGGRQRRQRSPDSGIFPSKKLSIITLEEGIPHGGSIGHPLRAPLRLFRDDVEIDVLRNKIKGLLKQGMEVVGIEGFNEDELKLFELSDLVANP